SSPITDYRIEYSTDNGATWTLFDDGVSTTTSATVTGLTNNRPYLFRVAAINLGGVGAYSTPAPAIPVAPVPDQATNELPELEPGESLVIVDGVPHPIVLEVVQDTILRLSGGDFSIALTSIDLE